MFGRRPLPLALTWRKRSDCRRNDKDPGLFSLAPCALHRDFSDSASPTSAVRGIGCCNFNGLAAKVVTTSRWPLSLGAGVLAGAIPVVAISGMQLCQV